MKLEWNTLNFPLDDTTEDYFWEKGLIINFNTEEAKARDLRMVDLYSEIIKSYKDEFLVVDITELKNRPKHLSGYEIKLLKIKDGKVSGEPFIINYPTKVSNAARWLRIVDGYHVIFEKEKDERIVYENEAINRQ